MKDSRGFGTLISITGELAHVVGYDLGPNVTVEACNDACIVLKIGGHNYWASIGRQAYAPTERAVFQIDKKLDEGRYAVHPLIQYRTRKK